MNIDDDFINQNQIDKLNITNKLLSNAFMKDKNEKITFHQIIDRDKECVKDYFKYPLFNDYFRFHNSEKKKNKNKKLKNHFSLFLRKQLNLFKNKIEAKKSQKNSNEKKTTRDSSIIKEINSNIEKSEDNIIKSNINIKLLKHKSLPNIFITKRQNPFNEISLSNFLTGLNVTKKKKIKNDIKLEEKNKIKKEKINEDNAQNESLFDNLSDDNRLNELLYNKESNTERNDYMNITKRMKNNNLVNDEKKINSLVEIIKNDIGKSNLKKWRKDQNYRISEFNKLIHRCSLEIDRGENIDKFIEENNGKLNETYKNIQNMKSKLIHKNDLLNIIDDNKINYKYKILEEKNFQKIKKQINMKISDEYIFKNKNIYKELLKNIDTEAYQILLKDLIENNKEKILNKKIEKSKMKKVEFLLDNTIKKKELLKFKISEKNKYYRLLKNQENIGPYFPLPGEINPPSNSRINEN